MDEKTIKLLALHQQARMQQEQLEQQEQADRNRAYEAEQLAKIQKKQAEILLAQSIEQENTNKKLIEIEKNKLLEETKRTKIAFEAHLSEEEVFDKGYNLDFSPIGLDLVHSINLMEGTINFDGTLNFDINKYSKDLFLLPKLSKAFLSGATKRRDEISSRGPTPDDMKKIAFEAGKDGKSFFSINYVPDSIKDCSIEFTLKSNQNLFELDSNTEIGSGIKSISFSKLNTPFENNSEFDYLNTAYKDGLNFYLKLLNEQENTTIKIEERVDEQNTIIILENKKILDKFEHRNLVIMLGFSLSLLIAWVLFKNMYIILCIIAVFLFFIPRKTPKIKQLFGSKITLKVKMHPKIQILILTLIFVLLFWSINILLTSNYKEIYKFIISIACLFSACFLVFFLKESYAGKTYIEIEGDVANIYVIKNYKVENFKSSTSFKNNSNKILKYLMIGEYFEIKLDDKHKWLIYPFMFLDDDFDVIKRHLNIEM